MAEEDEIHVELPRARVGGLQKGPVEDLLRRIARDYARLESENKKLWALLDATTTPSRPAGESPAGPAPAEEHQQAVEAVEAVGSPDPVSARLPGLGSSAFASALVESEPRRDMGELATAVLELAHRAASELRESTRQDCEVMIKKTRDRAEKLERELERSREKTTSELDELQAVQVEMREHMRASLQAVLRTFVAERAADRPLLEWSEMPGLFAVTEEREKKSKP
jgi:cell division septum initiation protein DivIVA